MRCSVYYSGLPVASPHTKKLIGPMSSSREFFSASHTSARSSGKRGSLMRISTNAGGLASGDIEPHDPMSRPLRSRTGCLLLFAFLATTLSGCVENNSFLVSRAPDGTVAVELLRCNEAGTVVLTVERFDGFDEQTVIWQIETLEPRHAANRFRLGDAPAGYTEVVSSVDQDFFEGELRIDPDPGVGVLGLLELSRVPDDGRVYSVNQSGDLSRVGGFERARMDHLSQCGRGMSSQWWILLPMAIMAAVGLVVRSRNRSTAHSPNGPGRRVVA